MTQATHDSGQFTESSCAVSEMIRFNPKLLQHRDKDIGQWKIVACDFFLPRFLTTAPMSTLRAATCVIDVLPVLESHVAATG